ncbi:MAG TPA: N-6 DNA methylase [Spirochaetales bacterium]|nr:N-6 DNA methylase [Spirochaetales bacterium]
MSDKDTGSFYTPEKLIQYMIDNIKERVSFEYVLEPSAGDGRFISPLKQYSQNITAIELDQEKVNSFLTVAEENVRIRCADFTEYSLKENEHYTLIIGNPPYISKTRINEEQRKRSVELVQLFEQSESLFQNLWVSFILGSLKLLSDGGAIFFVLPFEFLQVQYAEKLRVFLEEKFNTIEITTFQEQVFPDIEQDVCLVFLSNEKAAKPFVKYTTVKSVEEPDIIFESVIMRNKPLRKWSNCILNDDETEHLKNIARRYPQVKTFGEISPGIVTGANAFFIVDSNTVSKLGIEDFAIKIISKSNDIKGKFLLEEDDYIRLSNNGKKVYLINLNAMSENDFPMELKTYLEAGEKEEIHERYKCRERKRWYDVPIVKSGEACFFKRFHFYPRIIVNHAGVYTTDIAYNIRFHKEFDSESFVFCFYNSLTMALCEYNGRFYGGGVGELVPSEFKQLAIPYKKVDKSHSLHIDEMIRSGKPFSLVVDYVDSVVLELKYEEKALLQNIRNRFIQRRIPETL